jgi:hypothetical protein
LFSTPCQVAVDHTPPLLDDLHLPEDVLHHGTLQHFAGLEVFDLLRGEPALRVQGRPAVLPVDQGNAEGAGNRIGSVDTGNRGQILIVARIPVRHLWKSADQLRLHRFERREAVLRIPVPLISELHLAAPGVPGRLEAQRNSEPRFGAVSRLPSGRSGYGYVIAQFQDFHATSPPDGPADRSRRHRQPHAWPVDFPAVRPGGPHSRTRGCSRPDSRPDACRPRIHR